MTSQRENNRAMFPYTSVVVDEFREVFGDGVKLRFVDEGGKSAGQRLDESKYKVVGGADLCLTVPVKEEVVSARKFK